jgi:hypothetical protein
MRAFIPSLDTKISSMHRGVDAGVFINLALGGIDQHWLPVAWVDEGHELG